MRLLLSLVAVLALPSLAGCDVASELAGHKSEDQTDNDSGAGSPGGAECTTDNDCVAVGATCCECPSYAAGVEDVGAAVCNDVECPAQESCPENTRARCQDGTCMLACSPLACSNSCPDGYARDINGCLTCECAAPAGSCTTNSQCVQIAADCCGCTRGGADTAVRAGTEGGYRDMLGCQSDAQCPGVDTCAPGDAPFCVQGACALVQPVPATACGRPDLPTCSTCMVNANEQADMHGVGVCDTP